MFLAKSIDTEKPIRLRSQAEVSKHLGFSSEDDFVKWHESKYYKPFWEQLFENVITPRREEAARKNTQNKRFVNLSTIEAVEISGERAGRRRYSQRYPDFDDFTTLDWYAFVIHNVRMENTLSFDGIFYGRNNLRDHAKNCILWSLIGFDVYRTARSWLISGKRSFGTEIAGPAAKKIRREATTEAQLSDNTEPLSSIEQPTEEAGHADQNDDDDDDEEDDGNAGELSPVDPDDLLVTRSDRSQGKEHH